MQNDMETFEMENNYEVKCTENKTNEEDLGKEDIKNNKSKTEELGRGTY